MAKPLALNKEQIELVEKLAESEYTIDEIAKEVAAPRSTVAEYVKRAKAKIQEAQQLESVFVRRDRSPERLEELVSAIPGVGEGKLTLARMMIKQNPLLMTNPQEVYSFCIHALGVNDYAASFVCKTFFADLFSQGGANTSFMFPSGPIGMPQQQFGPMGNMGGFGQNFQTVQTPNGPVQVPLPPSQQPLSRAEMEQMLQERDNEQYVEETKPVLNPQTGQPIVGPDGQIVLQRTRRPVNQAPDPMQQMMQFMMAMKTMNEINGGGSLQQQLAALANRPAPGVDPATQQMLMQMQVQNAKVEAQLEAMRAVSERDAHWTKQLFESRSHEQQLKQELAIKSAGLSAQDQVSLKVVESGSGAVAKAMENMDKRMDRLERAAGPLLKTVMQPQPPPGQPASLPAQDLETIAGLPLPQQQTQQ
jgi:predicted DNA-binding protein YlxM (UPF0122 family)